MKTLMCLTLLGMLAATFVGTASAAAPAPQDHPHYLHALSDLRHARAYIDKLYMNEHRDDLEVEAIKRIDAAINTIKQASIDDHKDLNDHPPVDVHLHRADRYRKALELIDSAHRDVTMEEDNPNSQGLQGRVIAEVDHAHHIVERLQQKYH